MRVVHRKKASRHSTATGRCLRFESLEPREMLTGFTVNQITDDGLGTVRGSLSWAITQVNNTPGGNNVIVFDLAGSGHQIKVSGTLPNIQHALTTIQGIDGLLASERRS